MNAKKKIGKKSRDIATLYYLQNEVLIRKCTIPKFEALFQKIPLDLAAKFQ